MYVKGDCEGNREEEGIGKREKMMESEIWIGGLEPRKENQLEQGWGILRAVK